MSQEIKRIKEGTTTITVFNQKTSPKGPASKSPVPFYNPAMELNRDFSIVFVQWLINQSKRSFRLLDGLGASGIRGIRFAKEIEGTFEVSINDWNAQAYELIKKNVAVNKVDQISIYNRNINALLSEETYDYIDIDPFGSPVSYIDAALRSISHNGVIACTATDTATLCGVYPKACLRRYSARSLHSFVMHEAGLRILLGFLCREATKYDKGIEPLASYYDDHYFRTYIQIKNEKKISNSSIETTRIINPCEYIYPCTSQNPIGPLWMGNLQQKNVIAILRTLVFTKELSTKNRLWKLLSLLEEEANSPPFYFSTDTIASFLRCTVPKLDNVISSLKEQKFQATRTHFQMAGFKTNAPVPIIKEVFKEQKT